MEPLGQKVLGPSRRRMIQQALVQDWGLSIRSSCKLAGISRSHLNQPSLIEEDEFTRESLRIRVERRLRSEDVRLTLEVLFKDYGIPMYLRSENGSEFMARCLQDWLETQGTRPLFIEPGSPWQNGKCESFNGRFRDECLNLEWFDSLKEVPVVIEAWRNHYNQERPHSALNDMAPRQFIQHWQQEQSSLRQSA